MNKLARFCVMAAGLLGWVACNDEAKDLSDVAVIVTPSASDTVYMNAHEKKQYKLEYYTSTGGYVNRLQVRSFDPVYGERQLLDTLYGAETPGDTYIFSAPASTSERLLTTLTFTVWETTGKTTSQDRRVIIRSNTVLLQERGPIVLFMADGLHDGLTFSSPSQTFDHVLMGESRAADLYLDVEEDGTLVLRSATQARFVRYNDFDYSSTDAVSLQTVYGSSRLDDQIRGLSVNDIILAGHGTQAEGVFFVSNIVYSGTDNERSVQLSFKGLQTAQAPQPSE